MNTNELNEFIFNYIENDKTNSAIMLNAHWGAGKSFYIENNLANYLNEKDYKIINISLYGINDLLQLNKAIYFEYRYNKIPKKFKNKIQIKSESKILVSIIAKTLFRNYMNYRGINLNISDKDLNKLYNSIDFNKHLIILEDIERSNIDILDLMGYVNSMVERDKVKILLVANEEEIIKSQNDDNTDKNKYLIVKEKTIYDTLNFECNTNRAIENIIVNFNLLKNLSNYLSEIANLIGKNANLRSFIFACQKTNDIIDIINSKKSCEIEIIKYIFYGNIQFCKNLKINEKKKWEGDEYKSYTLGNSKYPLLKFCYDYIINHKSNFYYDNLRDIIEEVKFFNENLSNEDEDLNIIYDYYLNTENDVNNALKNVEKKLLNKEISYYQYGKLANYLFHIKNAIGYNISKMTNLILENLKSAKIKINTYSLFNVGIEITDKKINNEFQNYVQEVEKILDNDIDFDFDNINIENIDDFCKMSMEKRGKFLSKQAFAKNININKFVSTLEKCNPKEIDDIRGTFIDMYNSVNIKEFLKNDKPNLDNLINGLTELEEKENIDKIKKYQLRLFKKNLLDIVPRL